MGACREQREVERLLRESGAVYLGIRNHQKWRLPDGNCVTLACTCSDTRYWKNMLADIRRALGLSEAGPSKDTPRKPKKERKPGAPAPQREEGPGTPPLRSLADQLQTVGRGKPGS